ncbi:MAG: hypothetical protein GY702_26865, partial [Desulfobulbaceae bacterium]|nr:hypothetical protein [Desulfobulbaceae bacterium]
MKTFFNSFLLFLLIILYPPLSHGDWINLTGSENARNIAEIYVEKDHVKVKLEVFVEDLLLFKELIPDDFFPTARPGRPGIEKRIQLFADQTFQIVSDTGEKLKAKLDLVEPRMRVERPSPFAGSINPYTRRRIPGAPEDKRVLYAELTYPFSGQPKSLTFIPPVGDNGFP